MFKKEEGEDLERDKQNVREVKSRGGLFDYRNDKKKKHL